MEIVAARSGHLEEMTAIVERAKAAMAARGLDQWQRGYPNRAVLESDVEAGASYAALDEGRVLGFFRYCHELEASYESIDGAWLASGPYATIHRCAVDPMLHGRGIAGELLAFACEKARGEGMASVRIDTHADNASMCRAVEKAGFEPCGIIRIKGGLEDGSPRLAFERIVAA